MKYLIFIICSLISISSVKAETYEVNNFKITTNFRKIDYSGEFPVVLLKGCIVGNSPDDLKCPLNSKFFLKLFCIPKISIMTNDGGIKFRKIYNHNLSLESISDSDFYKSLNKIFFENCKEEF